MSRRRTNKIKLVMSEDQAKELLADLRKKQANISKTIVQLEDGLKQNKEEDSNEPLPEA